jgi:uracil-DNA glycosylase family protein
MRSRPYRSAVGFLPADLTIPHLRDASASCTGCDLYQRATQTVFGEGAPHARTLMIGEQPGDQEDRAGHPFVGPAGKLLDKALAEAGIGRDEVYITNAVKHFKWEPQGKRRKHKKPSAAEIAACRPWLDAEVRAIQPLVIVCLGVTAAQSAFGKIVRLHEVTGRFWETPLGPNVYVTIHPSAILRHQDASSRDDEYRRFVGDFRRIQQYLRARAA